MLIDKAKIERRFKRSVESYDENAYAQKIIIQRLISLINAYCPSSIDKILEIGCGTGLLTEQLQKSFKTRVLFINDLVDVMCSKTASRCNLPIERCIVGDIEQLELGDTFDLIASASTFQWLSNPQETFARLSTNLSDGGWMIFSTFGEDNFKELRSITGNGLVYHSVEKTINQLSSYFKVLHAEENHHVLEFSTPLDVLKHVKSTGVNGNSSPESWTRGKLNEFTEKYSEYMLTNRRFPLTYQSQCFVCQKIAF